MPDFSLDCARVLMYLPARNSFHLFISPLTLPNAVITLLIRYEKEDTMFFYYLVGSQNVLPEQLSGI